MNAGRLLSANARRHPARDAVILGERHESFAELDAASDRVASGLVARGLAPGDRVILYVGNSIELVELTVGVWKAGALAVPITTWIVGPELAYLVGDCRPFAVVHGPDQQAQVDEALAGQVGVRRIVIGDGRPGDDAIRYQELLTPGADGTDPGLAASNDADALIGYTSGTTGQPKGAVVTHANLINAQWAMSTYFELPLGETYLVTTPIAHRVGMSRLIACCVIGATLVVMPRFDPAGAVDLIARHRVNVLGTVPTVCRLLLEEMERRPDPFDSLRLVLATGEAFPVELKERLRRRLPAVDLITLYGMTEGGVPAALLPGEQLAKPASVGRLMPGVEVRLVGPGDAPVGPGESGEILLRSGAPGTFMVAREYFGRPEETAAAYRGGWFHTGDVGRFDADGYLYLVDRVKDMIVSGGLNIYSREVEQAIESLPAVREVAVVGAPDSRYGECVVAFVAARLGHSLTAETVLTRCRERLAGYKKPRHVLLVESLPRNATGKVLKTALRERARAEFAG